MKAGSLTNRITLFVVLVLSVLALSSCVKVEINLDIHQNGSILMSAALGLTTQAESMLKSSNSEPITPFADLLGRQTVDPSVKVTSWVDGDYAWVKYEKELQTPGEVNQLFTESKLFNKFSLTQTRGLLQNKYSLDAKLAPVSTDEQVAQMAPLGINITSIVSLRFSVRMPGKILYTNGIPDKNDPNLIYWDIQANNPVEIQARSVSTNLTTLLLALFGIIIIASIVVLVLLLRKPKKVVDNGSTESAIIESK